MFSPGGSFQDISLILRSPRSPFLSSCPVSSCFRSSFAWKADTEKQSSISYQNVNVLIFLERGDRVGQPELLTGEMKARNGTVSRPCWKGWKGWPSLRVASAYDHATGVPKLGRKSSGVVLMWRHSPGRSEAETSVRVEGGGGDCAKFLS